MDVIEQSIQILTERRDALRFEVNRLDEAIRALTDVCVPVMSQGRSGKCVCEKCGTTFERAQGASGRFCSRRCYVGDVTADERREIVLAAVREHGPIFVAHLVSQIDSCRDFKAASVHNDMQWLRNRGLVESVDDGWRAVEGNAPEGDEDGAVDAAESDQGVKEGGAAPAFVPFHQTPAAG